MSEPMTTLEAVHLTDPTVLERARRLQYAAALLRDGLSRREASGAVWRRYRCSRATAWRLVDMAADLVAVPA
jgi:hypothetical protein